MLFDAKTIHGGTAHYSSPHARDEQSGAVRHREHAVPEDYLRHARLLDRTYSAAGTTPVEDRLRWFTATRGLVWGQYSEASDDVHDLIRLASHALAEQHWALAGARSAREMRGFMVSRSRRRVGLAAAQAMARHRLARLPYIGVDRRVVVESMRRRTQARMGERVEDAPRQDFWEFFQFQGGPAAGAMGMAAA